MKRLLTSIARLFFGKRNSGALSRVYVLAFDILIVLSAICFVPLIGYYPDYQKASLLVYFIQAIPVFSVFIIGFLIAPACP